MQFITLPGPRDDNNKGKEMWFMYHQVSKKPAYPKRGGKERFYYCLLKNIVTETEKG